MAVSQAHRILHWQENLIGTEMPPEWMWPFEDELDEWFKEVERARKDKQGSNNDDDDDGDGAGMMSNEFADTRRGRR